jgi:hypothetical protein
MPDVLSTFTIGADPEMFLTKNGGYVAVQPYINGTKKKPWPLPSGGNAQRDNVAIEFGVEPAASKLQFIQNIGTTLMELKALLPDNVDIDIVPSADFPKDQLEHEECKEFGCEPDYNAWTMKMNKPPADAANKTFRSCGGHIHVGCTVGQPYDFLLHNEGKLMVVRLMDIFHGVVSVLLDDNEAAINRRKLYGKAGCYRETHYGVEYRTLSNYWIKDPNLVGLMYLLTEDVLTLIGRKQALGLIKKLGANTITTCINTGDKEMALDIMKWSSQAMSGDTLQTYQYCLRAKEANAEPMEVWDEVL